MNLLDANTKVAEVIDNVKLARKLIVIILVCEWVKYFQLNYHIVLL
jgi:hypothetical protein